MADVRSLFSATPAPGKGGHHYAKSSNVIGARVHLWQQDQHGKSPYSTMAFDRRHDGEGGTALEELSSMRASWQCRDQLTKKNHGINRVWTQDNHGRWLNTRSSLQNDKVTQHAVRAVPNHLDWTSRALVG